MHIKITAIKVLFLDKTLVKPSQVCLTTPPLLAFVTRGERTPRFSGPSHWRGRCAGTQPGPGRRAAGSLRAPRESRSRVSREQRPRTASRPTAAPSVPARRPAPTPCSACCCCWPGSVAAQRRGPVSPGPRRPSGRGGLSPALRSGLGCLRRPRPRSLLAGPPWRAPRRDAEPP